MTLQSDEGLTRFPDEDKLEKIQDSLFALAWSQTPQDLPLDQTINGLNHVLSVWNKTLASESLSQILHTNYLDEINTTNSPDTIRRLRQVDLILCFFHHYIYAFDEFVNRRFRNSVIRCGLVCERIVKRIAVASEKPDVLQLPKFEDKINRLRSQLQARSGVMDDLANFLHYVYRQRTLKGAHDTPAATALVAKSCMITAPNIYLLYLALLNDIGNTIEPANELVQLVNSTISTGTSLVVSQEGRPIKPAQVLESLYKTQYFKDPRTLADVETKLKDLGFAFPKPTLFHTLARLCAREGLLVKKKKTYVQRLPPEEYYRKEIVD
jgi:hypothetical protein